jgi:hypothetical protein
MRPSFRSLRHRPAAWATPSQTSTVFIARYSYTGSPADEFEHQEDTARALVRWLRVNGDLLRLVSVRERGRYA